MPCRISESSSKAQIGLTERQCRLGKLVQLNAGRSIMTEYVIREVGLHQWLVFADRKCVACCVDEEAAAKAMAEHSARRPRLPSSSTPYEAIRRRDELGLKAKGK
jgi:hypothetical protein